MPTFVFVAQRRARIPAKEARKMEHINVPKEDKEHPCYIREWWRGYIGMPYPGGLPQCCELGQVGFLNGSTCRTTYGLN